MVLDELLTAIEEQQRRIAEHGNLLRQNEYRTRLSLIDPVLEALGWKIGDPALVLPEYDVNGKRADYALLDRDGNPAVLLEAKKLDESLSSHRSQVVAYASELGIKYPALTNGNRWEVYDNSLLVPIEQRRILEVEICDSPAALSALRLLFLWRPNQWTGAAIAPSVPVEPAIIPHSREDGWVSLADLQGDESKPLQMRFPDGREFQPHYWNQVLIETAEWLIRAGHLTAQRCPIPDQGRTTIVNTVPRTVEGREFIQPHTLSNGIFLNKHANRRTLLARVALLTEHLQQETSSILLKFG